MTYRARLRAIQPSENRFREYELETRPAPDGGWLLITRRGRIGGKLRPREDYFPTEEALADEIARNLRIRTAHGYVLER